MPHIKISSTDWLAVSLRNGTTGVFYLHDPSSWQCLPIEDEQSNDLRRNLIKFSPNGRILVCNGQDKQLNVYMQSDFVKTEVWWKLQRKIIVKNPPLSIDLTNKSLYIADINGDIYRVDLLFNDQKEDLIISAENCLMKNKYMSLDIVFIQMNEKKSYLITADQEDQLCVSHYPNIADVAGSCLGHTEFITHVKLIDNNHILSASADGTIRLWRLPTCVPLVLLHSKAFVLLSKEVFYTGFCIRNNASLTNDYVTDAIPQATVLSTSSIIDYSIWKMDVTNDNSNILIAFSTYAHRFHSIYLTNLTNMKELANEQRKLTFDSDYGTIVDYCFVNPASSFDLYILFHTNIVLQVDTTTILLCNRVDWLGQPNEIMQEINDRLAQKEFHLNNCRANLISFDEMIFEQGLKSPSNANSKHFSHKRKVEQTENEQRKKQIGVADNDESMRSEECS